MDDYANLLHALAALAWPAVVGVLLWKLAPLLHSILETAKTREFAVEVGGQKLTMKEANRLQDEIIKDMQTRILALEQDGGLKVNEERMLEPPSAVPEQRRQQRVLWVDDNPKNNGYMIQRLVDGGVRVDIAVSTADGLQRLSSESYDLILSDMGRHEQGRFNPIAGLDLLRLTKKKGYKSPVVFCTSHDAVTRFKREAETLGAAGITASNTELWGFIRTALGRNAR